MSASFFPDIMRFLSKRREKQQPERPGCALARRVFGSVGAWELNCKNNPDPSERNQMVLRSIYLDHPEFRRQIQFLGGPLPLP